MSYSRSFVYIYAVVLLSRFEQKHRADWKFLCRVVFSMLGLGIIKHRTTTTLQTMLAGAVISDFWVGKEADIRGCGGRISANLKENSVRTIARYSRQQEEDSNVVTKFVVEKAPGAYAENFVAFRVKGTKLYLTMNISYVTFT